MLLSSGSYPLFTLFFSTFLFAVFGYVYVPSLSHKVGIAQGIENEFDPLSWHQENSGKTQH